MSDEQYIRVSSDKITWTASPAGIGKRRDPRIADGQHFDSNFGMMITFRNGVATVTHCNGSPMQPGVNHSIAHVDPRFSLTCFNCGFTIYPDPELGYPDLPTIAIQRERSETMASAATRMTRDEARAMMKEAAAQLAAAEALLKRHGEDLPDGAVIRFTKIFPARTMDAFPPVTIAQFGDDYDMAVQNAATVTHSAIYHYAAIRVNGLWYTTGPKAPKGFPWEELLTWLEDPVPAPHPIEVLSRGWSADDLATQLAPVIANHVGQSLRRELHQLIDDYARSGLETELEEYHDKLDTLLDTLTDQHDPRESLRQLFGEMAYSDSESRQRAFSQLAEIVNRYHVGVTDREA